MGSRTDLPYLGIAMMEEFNELEVLLEISSCCDITDSCYSTSSSSVGIASQRMLCGENPSGASILLSGEVTTVAVI